MPKKIAISVMALGLLVRKSGWGDSKYLEGEAIAYMAAIARCSHPTALLSSIDYPQLLLCE
jgi:hypothetical protein